MFRPLHSITTLNGFTQLKNKIKEYRNPMGTNKKGIQINTNKIKANNKTPIHITPPSSRTMKSEVFRAD